MPCYHPITAWRSAKGVFFRVVPDSSQIALPCSRCIGCRLERSRQWAVRLMHELKQHERSSFITLTYEDSFLPVGGTLVVKHFQDFMKRLRFGERCSSKIRFFHCGEYGERRRRPHYHAILFGVDFDLLGERYDQETSPRGDTTWSSKRLDDYWQHQGMARVGRVTFESCAYVARYVTKKLTGARAREYERCATVDQPGLVAGEIFRLQPEYATMSRRPGIGYAHLERFLGDVYPSDQCVVRGHPSKPPKFYDKQLEKWDPELYLRVKERRESALVSSSKKDRTERRLQDRETVKLAQIRTLTRRYELG